MTLIMSIRIATGLRARQSGIWFLEGATDFPHLGSPDQNGAHPSCYWSCTGV